MGSNYYLGGNVTNHDTIKALRDALTEARSSLVHSYNVTDYPADGETAQDKSIANIDRVLALTADASDQAPDYTTGRACSVCYGRGYGVDGKACPFDCRPAARPAPVAATPAPDVEKMLETNQLDELGQEVARLQKALCFWLPSITDREDEVAERILQDAFLLCGIDGNIPDDFKSAQELGWVTLAAAPAAPITKGSKND